MNVSEFVPGMDHIEVAEMPNAILIGKARRNSQLAGAPAFRSECYNKGILKKPAELPRLIPNHMLGWSGDCPESEENANRDFTYWNAELYLDGEPDEDKWSRMIPIKKETVSIP